MVPAVQVDIIIIKDLINDKVIVYNYCYEFTILMWAIRYNVFYKLITNNMYKKNRGKNWTEDERKLLLDLVML